MRFSSRFFVFFFAVAVVAAAPARAQELDIDDLPRPETFKYYQLGRHVPPRSGWTNYIGGREVLHDNIRLPLEIDPTKGEHMYCNTQVWGFKDNGRPTGKSNNLANYRFPWTSTFCEKRDFPGVTAQATKMCRLDSAGRMRQSHQGSDCRPPAPKADHYWMVAVEDGKVTLARHNEIQLVGVSGIKWKYRHGNVPRAEIRPSGGRGVEVKRGTRLAQVTDLKSTPIHLHIESERPATSDRDNMPSLILAYQRALGVAPSAVQPNGELAFDSRFEIAEGVPVAPCAESESLASIGTEQLNKFSSLWCHNDSIMGMVEAGSSRKLVYYKPKASVREAARREPVIFEGTVSGEAYQGQAVWYSSRCSERRFDVTGTDADTPAARWLTLKGTRPSFPAACDLPKFIEETLTFSFMRPAEIEIAGGHGAAPDPGPAPKPEAGPAPKPDAVPGATPDPKPEPEAQPKPEATPSAPAPDAPKPDAPKPVGPAPEAPKPAPKPNLAGIDGPCAETASADTIGTETWFKFTSLWCHNRSLMGVVEDGDKRTIVYLKPRPGIRDTAARNPVLFEGTLAAGALAGSALWYSNDCGDKRFDVTGSEALTGGARMITVSGSRQSFASGCSKPKTVEETLAFSFIRTLAGQPIGGTAPGGAAPPADTPKPSAGGDTPKPADTPKPPEVRPEEPITISSCTDSESEASLGTETQHTFTSLWCHNRSIMGLVADGDKRSLVYYKPRPGIRDTVRGAPPLFEGARTGNTFSGQALWFNDTCGNRKFDVTGKSTTIGSTQVIALSGKRPSFPGSCDAPEFKDERLVFSFLRNWEPVVAGTTPAPEPKPDEPSSEPGSAGTGGDGFSLPAPDTGSLQKHRLWATQYYVYKGPHLTGADTHDLRNKSNDSFGAKLKRVAWCKAAVEGTALVTFEAAPDRGFNYAGRGQSQVNCSGMFGRGVDAAAVGRSVWFELPKDAPYGIGNHHMVRLVPFRSIASDQTGTSLKRGTVLFVPSLRGKSFTLFGKPMVHDGYLYVADVGGAIKGSHIDIFTGTQTSNPFPSLIKSSSAGSFDAYTVTSSDIKASLKALHQR